MGLLDGGSKRIAFEEAGVILLNGIHVTRRLEAYTVFLLSHSVLFIVSAHKTPNLFCLEGNKWYLIQ